MLAALKDRDPRIQRVAARRIHVCLCRDDAATADSPALRSLSRLFGPAMTDAEVTGYSLLVMPRPGTTSAWSSKATDIVDNLGLEMVSRVEAVSAWRIEADGPIDVRGLADILHDRMTEAVFPALYDLSRLFAAPSPKPQRILELGDDPRADLAEADAELGLALAPEEIDYLATRYAGISRFPTDTELMMFAQANSEHCRHKIFNARWTIDGVGDDRSLFDAIRESHARAPGRVLSAYRDNAAVMSGFPAHPFAADPDTGAYEARSETPGILMKVETHNHPTAISPFPGAATGAGGEIRDEGATGRGGRPRAGLTGFAVSHLRLPERPLLWEPEAPLPPQLASPLAIMLEGPIGAARYNNEFGRPALGGFFRTFEQVDGQGRHRGYLKPIMLAGGVGTLRADHVAKAALPAGARIVVLGGPGMRIGLGGGAASSLASGSRDAELDYASVQRDNAELERRCQEVIDACTARGDRNPILSIHDVGAGGLSNAVPELLDDAGRGGRVDLDAIPTADPSLSPLEIWCNEAQERYVLGLAPDDLDAFRRIAERERCPFADIGEVTAERQLVVTSPSRGVCAVDLPMDLIFGETPRMHRTAERAALEAPQALDTTGCARDALVEVLRHPTVADKGFLITIGDRTVSGLTVRDQMVGPWQVPVADCAVTAADYEGSTGEAFGVGERTPLALASGPASGRMAVAEALTNLAAARIARIEDISLSANWMAAAGDPSEEAVLFDTVNAVGRVFCPALGIPIPVGKDSLSMRTRWSDAGEDHEVTAPVSLIVTAFAPVADVTKTLTPVIGRSGTPSVLVYVDLGAGRYRLGGSILAQTDGIFGGEPPDADDPALLKRFFNAVQALNDAGYLLAYHDRSDGGLAVTLAEMAFAGRTGISVNVPSAAGVHETLFAEELGAVLEVPAEHETRVVEALAGMLRNDAIVQVIGRPVADSRQLEIAVAGQPAVTLSLDEALNAWCETSYRMRALRDAPDCAEQEYAAATDSSRPGLELVTSFEADERPAAPFLIGRARPRVAVLREQGINGHREMAAAFTRAGFDACDVHMTDLAAGRLRLEDFRVLAAAGGFSYGDVLGAGTGWALGILERPELAEAFRAFFERPDTLTFGVCNGCQMLSQLKALIPGAAHWPRFGENRSERFEARLSLVEVTPGPAVMLAGMAGSRIPLAVSHGEGRADLDDAEARTLTSEGLAPLRYVEPGGGPAAASYPANPNGSPQGVTGFTSRDGRALVMMPHPERVFLSRQLSWLDAGWRRFESPWFRLFENARAWVG